VEKRNDFKKGVTKKGKVTKEKRKKIILREGIPRSETGEKLLLKTGE